MRDSVSSAQGRRELEHPDVDSRNPQVRTACDSDQCRVSDTRGAPASLAERDLDLDLDRPPTREGRAADWGAGVAARVTEDVAQQAARAVHDRGLLDEPGRRRDEGE